MPVVKDFRRKLQAEWTRFVREKVVIHGCVAECSVVRNSLRPALESVLLRQKQSRDAAIGFGDQPELVTGCCGIGAQ